MTKNNGLTNKISKVVLIVLVSIALVAILVYQFNSSRKQNEIENLERRVEQEKKEEYKSLAEDYNKNIVQDFDAITVGMDKSDIIDKIGYPSYKDEIILDSGTVDEIWSYDEVSLIISNGKISAVSPKTSK